METRYKENQKLKTALEDLNLYDPSMNIEEMRKMLIAVSESQVNPTDQYETHIASESEIVFVGDHAEHMGNSTMISVRDSPENTDTDSSDRADVHHEFDWSPTRESRLRDPVEQGESEAGSQLRRRQLNNGKIEDDPLPSFIRNDSGVNCSGESSGSSSIDNESSMANSGELEESHSHVSEESDASMPNLSTSYFDYDDNSNASF